MILALVILVILVIVSFSKLSKLEKRIQILEKGTVPTQTASVSPAGVPTATPAASIAELTAFPPPADTQTPTMQPPKEGLFVKWLKEDTMMKLGALLLLLALGWFVSYSFANNWIGPVGRIALGLLTGIAFLGAGVWRIKKYMHQGSVLTVVGATTVLLTLFAARGLYDFFTPSSALTLMFFTVVFVAFVSIRYNTQSLALWGLVLAGIAPFLTNTPTPDVSGIFLYLLIVTLGTLWVVWRTGWCTLTFAALLIAFGYSVPYLGGMSSSAEQGIALLYAFVFVGIFFIANIISLIFRKDASYAQAHIYTALGTGVYLVSWVLVAADAQWQSLLYTAWSLVFMVGAYIVYRSTSNRIAFYMYGATSVVLIGAATAAELSGAVLVTAYALEALLMLAIAAYLRASASVLVKLSFIFVIPVALSLSSFDSSSWYASIFHKDSATLVTLFVTLFAAGMMVFKRKSASDLPEVATVMKMLFITSAGYAVSIVWLAAHALIFSEVAATVVSLIMYTIAGIVMMVTGTNRHIHALRIGGIVLISLVVAELLLVEIWNLSMAGKIISFFSIGLLLISTAFYQKQTQKKEVIQTNLTD